MLLLLIATLCVGIGFISASGLYWLAVAPATVLAVALLYSRDDLVAASLGATAAFPGLSLPIGPYHLHLFVLVALVLFVRRPMLAVTGQSALSAGALIAFTCLLGSTVFFGDLSSGAGIGVELVALGVSAVSVAHVGERRLREVAIRSFLLVTAAGASVSILQFAHVVPAVLIHEDISALGRPSGWYGEPDWLGLFSALGFFLALRLPDLRPQFRYAAAVVCFIAMMLSFARAAWLALLVVTSVALVFQWRERRGSGVGEVARLARVLAVVMVAASCVLAVLPSMRQDLLRRLESTYSPQPDDISLQARNDQFAALVYLASNGSWYGRGLGSSGRVDVHGQISYAPETANHVGTNWLLNFWTEGGVLAIPLGAFLIILAVRRRNEIDGQMLALILLSSLFSNALFFPITWFIVGIAIVPLRLASDGGERRSMAEAVA